MSTPDRREPAPKIIIHERGVRAGRGRGMTAKCWCGQRDAFFAGPSDGLDLRCGGSGTLHCYCGGDFCVCHNHGEVECEGCLDCQDDDDWHDGPYGYEDMPDVATRSATEEESDG